MQTIIVSGICGCLRLFNFDQPAGLIVQDYELLPLSKLGVYAFRLSDNVYIIDSIFNSREDLLYYLNNTFASDNNLIGTFAVNSTDLIYSNPEYFNEAELIMVYKNEKRCYVVGTPEVDCDPSKLDAVIQTGVAADTLVRIQQIRDLITDVQVLDLRVETVIVTEDNDAGAGYQRLIQNCNVYVITQQIPGYVPPTVASIYYGVKSTMTPLTESEILATTSHPYVTGDDITAVFNNTDPACLWIAFPSTEQDIINYMISNFDYGQLGPGGTFSLPELKGPVFYVQSNYFTQASQVTLTK